MNQKKHHVMIATVGLLLVTGHAACTDDNGVVTTTTDYGYEDAYLYGGYYPADVAYSSYYWAYPWDYAGFYYLTDDTAQAAPARSGIAAAVEALARGQTVCQGQVTVMEKTAAPACQGSNANPQRAGVTIVFNGCQAPGGTINGMIDVTSNLTASEQTCSSTTKLTLGHTSTFTNLSITLADGRKLAIPNGTNTGMTTFNLGSSPPMLDINSMGELQIFDSSGTVRSDLSYNGDTTFTFSGTQSYTINGTTTVQEKNGNASATITRNGLVRSGGCCRPTSGTMTVNRMGGSFPGQANWSFGPSCGQVQRNNATATMPACM